MKRIILATSLSILLLAGCGTQEASNKVEKQDNLISETTKKEPTYFRLRYDRGNN